MFFMIMVVLQIYNTFIKTKYIIYSVFFVLFLVFLIKRMMNLPIAEQNDEIAITKWLRSQGIKLRTFVIDVAV